MAETIAAAYGNFIERTGFEAMPPEALPIVRNGFTDCIAVMMAGAGEPAVDIVRTTSPQGAGRSRILLSSTECDAAAAALVNGTAAHALDYDDVAMSAHPSAVLVPAVMALADEFGASGREMVTAYAVGYELWADLARRDQDHHHRKGWHPTAVFGTLGAAAAAAKLLRLEAEASARAVGIAASLSSGLMANFGTMTKPLHVGWAAQSGVRAAKLAQAGLTCALDVLEHPQGFLSAFSPNGRVELGPPEGGAFDRDRAAEWRLGAQGLNIKKYPLCYSTHRSIDGMLDLLSQRPLRSEDIDEIVVTMGATQAAVLRNSRPTTALEAKFSEEFAMAAAVVFGRVGLAELDDRHVTRADVQDVMRKVRVETTDAEDPLDPVFAPFEKVLVRTGDGEELDSGEIRHARGHALAPISSESLWEKFRDCALASPVDTAPRGLFDALQGLERLEGTRRLPRLGRPDTAA